MNNIQYTRLPPTYLVSACECVHAPIYDYLLFHTHCYYNNFPRGQRYDIEWVTTTIYIYVSVRSKSHQSKTKSSKRTMPSNVRRVFDCVAIKLYCTIYPRHLLMLVHLFSNVCLK